MKFLFEDLEVYQRSLRLVERVEQLALSLRGKVSYSFIDQMTRAALSVPLNIAEGNGRWHKNDKKNFLWIARGSVFELVPIMAVFRNKRLIDEHDHEELVDELAQIGKMLTALCKSIDVNRF